MAAYKILLGAAVFGPVLPAGRRVERALLVPRPASSLQPSLPPLERGSTDLLIPGPLYTTACCAVLRCAAPPRRGPRSVSLIRHEVRSG